MLFSGLPESAFEEDLAPIDHFLFPDATVLLYQGQNDEAIFTIRKGLVKLVSLTERGEQRIVRLADAGSAVGLELLARDGVCQHSAIALGDVDVCRVPVSTVLLLEQRFPALCMQIRHRLQDQLDQADRWIVQMSTGSVTQRVANLMLFMQQGADESGAFPLLSGIDTAAIVGAAQETVSRVVAAMKRDGTLVKQPDGCFRGNLQQLQALAGVVNGQ
jgi:CRP/FNR family transcriptional regulator